MAELINKKDTLNEGREKLNAAIENAEQAKWESDQALNKANSALLKSESTQTQLNEIVIEGDSSVEAAQARVSVEGTAYGTLKQRLDTEYEEVTTQLAQKANYEYIDSVISNLVGGSPQEVFSTLTDLETAYPTGANGVFLVLDNGDGTGSSHVYFWNGTNWVDAGVYQGTGLGAFMTEQNEEWVI